MRLTVLVLASAALAGIATHRADAQHTQGPALGIRIGTSGGTRHGSFTAVDVTGSVMLPWRLGSATGWSLDAKAEATFGSLSGAGNTGLVGSIGPSLALRRAGFPLYLDGGTSAAFTSERQFGAKNLGTNIQFISHISVLAQVGSMNTGYRLQHMSNASLSEHNPGVNQHMLELRYTFR
ncbi:MAG TPA: acyloxyacyl hydrolase [Gemmatimonadaceae bacterium]|nr:acyloxyacyl hydrolase [Gemmatimonadaceae bacterium]